MTRTKEIKVKDNIDLASLCEKWDEDETQYILDEGNFGEYLFINKETRELTGNGYDAVIEDFYDCGNLTIEYETDIKLADGIDLAVLCKDWKEQEDCYYDSFENWNLGCRDPHTSDPDFIEGWVKINKEGTIITYKGVFGEVTFMELAIVRKEIELV